MPGFEVGKGSATIYTPTVLEYDLAASQTIRRGDLVVLTGVSSITRVRKLVAADITNNFTESSTVKGILGMAMHDAVTNASGVSLTPYVPSTVDASGRPIYAVPNYAAGIDSDPVTGTSRLAVAIFDALFQFLATYQAASNAAATVTPNIIGSTAGVQVWNTTDFALNSGASGAGLCAEVTGVDEQDPSYNTSSTKTKVFCKVLPAYQQINLGVLYAS